MDYRRIFKSALWVSGMIILLMFTVIWYRVLSYNNGDNKTDNSTEDAKVFFEMASVEEVVDTWTTAMQLSDNPEDVGIFTGATFSGRVINNNNFDINDWTLHMVVNDECYLNSFWCGSVTVTQNRNGNTITDTVSSQYSDITQIKLDVNEFSSSMMIHLLPGDEIVYTPSKEEGEEYVKAQNLVGIGFIFYFRDDLDLSSWELTYRNNLNFGTLIYTRIALILAALWVSAMVFYLSLASFEKRMREQMESRAKSISIMSDIYAEAYIVDIDRDTARLIKGEEGNLIVGLEDTNVQQAINDAVINRCVQAYHEELLKFLDLSTVMDRMEGVTSITTEFVGNSIGWCAVRIFKEEGNHNNVVITLQDINEEKKKLRLIEDKINLAEHKQHVSGSFLGTVSFAINDISQKIGMDAGEIMSVSNQEDVKSLADRVICNTRHMNLIQNMMIDFYNIETKSLQLNIHRYCITDMLDELYHILSVYAEGKSFKFSFDVDSSVPAYLEGDSDRIEQILIILLFSSMMMTQQGRVAFSLHGMRIDEEVELLFEIKDTAGGFTEEQVNEVYEFIRGSNVETFDNASLVYLRIINGILNYMDSQLKIVSVLNDGTDFYFSLRQGISTEQ